MAEVIGGGAPQPDPALTAQKHQRDMTLVVGVSVTGKAHADKTLTVKATYHMVTSVPPAPQGTAIVDSSGDINLKLMPGGPGFTEATDIYFVLSGSVTGPDGGSYPVFFRKSIKKAVTITPDAGVKPSFPGTGNRSVLLIDDLDKKQAVYDYTLHVLAYIGPGKPSIGTAVDPQIVNR